MQLSSAIGIVWRPHGAVLHTYTSPLFMEFLAGVWLSELAGKISGLQGRGCHGGRRTDRVRDLIAATRAGPLALSCLGSAEPARGMWAISMELRRGRPRIKSLKLLGDGSYSIYLFHPFVFLLVTAPLARLPALIPVVVVASPGSLSAWLPSIHSSGS